MSDIFDILSDQDCCRCGTQSLEDALRSPELKNKMEEHGLVAAPSTPAAFGEFMVAERKRWSAIVRQAGLKPE